LTSPNLKQFRLLTIEKPAPQQVLRSNNVTRSSEFARIREKDFSSSALIESNISKRWLEALLRQETVIEQKPIPGEALAAEEAGKFLCPRCSKRLPRPEFVKHLWLEHHLVLDGRSVREPWRLIEDWLEEFCQTGKPELLNRCRAFAQRIDPEEGIPRVERLFLAHRIEDEKARRSLLAEARDRQASLCPRCFALVFGAEEKPVHALEYSHGRLAGRGYLVEVSERGFFSQLTVLAPGKMIFQGPEPDRWLSGAGAEVVLAGPFVLLALVMALLMPSSFMSPLLAVTFILLGALAAKGIAHWGWQVPESSLDRAVNYAWTLLVPRLETDGFTSEDLDFLAGLALASIGHGRVMSRADNLQRALNYVGKKATAGAAPVTQLAALWRLVVEDRAKTDDDPVLLVTAQVGVCFEGHLPLSFAENLLAGWESSLWTQERLSRLRILLCERAFEEGFEVRDLLAVGIAAPALGEALQIRDAEGLCRLRLLWSLRPSRPWDPLGFAVTAFDVARRPESNPELLADYPDLLLKVTGEVELLLSGGGVIFRDVRIDELPRSIEVKSPPTSGLLGKYELILGNHRFEFSRDPEELVPRLERWLRYHFSEFLPQSKHVLGWRSPGLPLTFRLQKTVPCPECRRELLPRIGDLAVMVEESSERRTLAP
jgi:hypothetical protein